MTGRASVCQAGTVPENGPDQVYFLSSPWALKIVGVKDHKVLTPAILQTAVK